jgi:cyclopropane-fatty-acyl-phospholipid synthase
MAEKFPNSQIRAVSNSGSQKKYILRLAAARNLHNLKIITKDMTNLRLENFVTA